MEALTPEGMIASLVIDSPMNSLIFESYITNTLAKKVGLDQILFIRYTVEQLLYRLARSEHRVLFMLNGALLFAIWTGDMHRPTRNLDLMGLGDGGAENWTVAF